MVKPLLNADRERNELSSYRQLYTISFLSKVLETVCLKQLIEHLSKKPPLEKLQLAYRRDHSVETAVTKVYNNLIINETRGKDTILVFLDLSAAFETVDRDMLLLELMTL